MPAPRLFARTMCLIFWQALWAAPWRAAIGGSFVEALLVPLPEWPVLRRLGPLWLQRLIAQAVINRYAWMRETHIPVLPRFEEDSVICWDDLVRQPAERQCLQEADEWELSRLFGVYLDWLMQIIDLAEGQVGARERPTGARLAEPGEAKRSGPKAGEARRSGPKAGEHC